MTENAGIEPWSQGHPGKFLIGVDGVLWHWQVDDDGLPSHADVRLAFEIESLMEGDIEASGRCWATERDVSCGPDLVGVAFDAVSAEGLRYADRRPARQTPTTEQLPGGRDPDRIPMVLAALEREWRKDPDARLGQLLVNLVRVNVHPLREEEGRILFNVEDGQLMRWIGAETQAEETYIREEPRKAREGWSQWVRSFRESEAYNAWRQSWGRRSDEPRDK